ncbi:32337_t:CDS:2, partial [Gigaspora margarita]
VSDIEPTITYKDHTAAINSVGHYFRIVKCYSTSIDSTLCIWDLLPLKRDTYGPVALKSSWKYCDSNGELLVMEVY